MGINKVTIGKKVRIFPGLRLEVHGEGHLSIGNNVAIGQNFHVTCAQLVEIGHGTLITADVMVTDIDHRYQEYGTPVLDQGIDVKPTKIGPNCFIDMGSRIQAGTILGEQCIVGANSVVRGHFEAGSVLVGSPARVVKKYNSTSHTWENVTRSP